MVVCAKPSASRNASIESFVVCKGFGCGKLTLEKCFDLELEGGWDDIMCGGVGGLREEVEKREKNEEKEKGEMERDASCSNHVVHPTIVPFVACSTLRDCDDEFIILDSDKSYAVSGEVKAALAPPIQPPYQAGMAKAKEARLQRKADSL